MLLVVLTLLALSSLVSPVPLQDQAPDEGVSWRKLARMQENSRADEAAIRAQLLERDDVFARKMKPRKVNDGEGDETDSDGWKDMFAEPSEQCQYTELISALIEGCPEALEHFPIKSDVPLQVWVASAGGTSSNLLWEFIAGAQIGSKLVMRSKLDYRPAFQQRTRFIHNVGKRSGVYGDHLCHAGSPLHASEEVLWNIERAIFLWDDPCRQVDSLYRRQLQTINLNKRIRGRSSEEAAPEVALPKSMEQYVRRGKDTMRLQWQFDQWNKHHHNVTFPVVLINAKQLWKFLPALLDHLTLPRSILAEFPRMRRRKLEGSESMNSCRNMYSDFYRELENEPPFKLLCPSGQSENDPRVTVVGTSNNCFQIHRQ